MSPFVGFVALSSLLTDPTPTLAVISHFPSLHEESSASLTGARGGVTLLGGHLDPRPPKAKAELEIQQIPLAHGLSKADSVWHARPGLSS